MRYSAIDSKNTLSVIRIRRQVYFMWSEWHKFFKFLFIGIVNTLVGGGIMFLLYNCFGLLYWISSVCNYIAGGALSFFLNKHFTFHNNECSFLQIFLFILNLLLCYFIAYGLSKKVIFLLLSSRFSEKQCGNIALFCGICLYTILNYLGQRQLVFGHERKE